LHALRYGRSAKFISTIQLCGLSRPAINGDFLPDCEEATMLELGQGIALALLLAWCVTAFMVVVGKARTPQFAAISTVMTLFIPFFWLSGEITELTISRVGSLKTNLQDAKQIFRAGENAQRTA
jgi:hypothetical protein